MSDISKNGNLKIWTWKSITKVTGKVRGKSHMKTNLSINLMAIL